MSDREKLIKLMFEALKYVEDACEWSTCEGCYLTSEVRDCRTIMAADHLISNGVTVQKWIPVSERLPDGADGKSLCDTVIAYLDNGEANAQVCVGWLNGDKWYLTVGNDDHYTVWGVGAVTHWMPMPLPPKECE